MSVNITTIGKREIYSPAHYKLHALLDDDPNNWIVVDVLFTWDLEEALDLYRSLNSMWSESIVVIDGTGWVNSGGEPFFPRDYLEQLGHFVPKEDYQVAQLTDGCPRNCPWCYSDGMKEVELPVIVKNHVKLIDENSLAFDNIIMKLDWCGQQRVNGLVVYYEFIPGVDRRFLSLEKAEALKRNRFKNIRIAWDGPKNEGGSVARAIRTLQSVGYRPKDISVFMLTDGKWVSFEECKEKLLSLWEWGVKVNDCRYELGTNPSWSQEDWTEFRRICRKHNQLVNFDGYDPEAHEHRPHPLEVAV